MDDKGSEELVIEHDSSKVLSLDGEQTYFAAKQHIFTLVPVLLLTIFLTIIFLIISLASFLIFKSWIVTVLCLLTVFLIGIGLIAQTFINWYYHIYIVTSRKLLEIKYAPMSGHISNEIFLEQVKCTEIDMKASGFISQFLNIGNVEITFDRHTQTELFILSNISNYRKVGTVLTNKLINKQEESKKNTQEFWVKSKDKPNRYDYIEEISNRS
jgi:hypothetical protein